MYPEDLSGRTCEGDLSVTGMHKDLAHAISAAGTTHSSNLERSQECGLQHDVVCHNSDVRRTERRRQVGIVNSESL